MVLIGSGLLNIVSVWLAFGGGLAAVSTTVALGGMFIG